MGYLYDTRRRAGSKTPAAQPKKTFEAGPSMDALRAGLAQPSAEQMGSRVELPDAVRAKFESSFGADLSAVKLYRSQAVADAGANAVTQGSSIAFAPGMLDFTSRSGQALLGHEISHVVSQQRGEVRGSGFLNDRALEARADREGAMAAAGERVVAPSAPLSGASAAPAAGPMQAKKESKEEKQARKDNEIVDELFRIGNGQRGLEEGVSEEEEAFYNYHTANMSRGVFNTIQGRYMDAAERSVQERDAMTGDDAARLDFEAAYSDPQDDMSAYQHMMTNFAMQRDRKRNYLNRDKYEEWNKAYADRLEGEGRLETRRRAQWLTERMSKGEYYDRVYKHGSEEDQAGADAFVQKRQAESADRMTGIYNRRRNKKLYKEFRKQQKKKNKK